MPAFSASAPGKVILFGEHAVVYGQPAIAVPVPEVTARAKVTADIQAPEGQILIQAPEVGKEALLSELPHNDPLAAAVRFILQKHEIERPPAFRLRINSTIPVAAGLGSGAAVSVAIIRSVSAFLGQLILDEEVSALAFEVEKLHHGTPSGIDNSIVTFAKPVYYVKGQHLEYFEVRKPFTLLIADSGIPSPTRAVVEDVRRGWEGNPKRYDAIFAAIGTLAPLARQAIEDGENEALGALMDANHTHLQELQVSSPALDRLVEAAREAGALGAKLSGGGRGGNMIALVTKGQEKEVAAALMEAGAVNTIVTSVQ